MRLYVDLDTLNVIQTPGVNTPVKMLEFKRGDAAVLEVQFLSNSTPVLLPAGAALIFEIKKLLADTVPVVMTGTWVTPTDPATEFYTAEPSFNTTELNTALGLASSFDGFGEISWLLAGKETSTKTFTCRIHKDVHVGDEGDPTPAVPPFPSPETILVDADIGVTVAAYGHVHAAADITSGQFAMARIASGTPNGTKFVRDDGTLAVPEGGGGGDGGSASMVSYATSTRPAVRILREKAKITSYLKFKGLDIAIGFTVTGLNAIIYYSADGGVSWRVGHISATTNTELRAIATDGETAIAVGDVAYAVSSTDGITWSPVTVTGATHLGGIAYNAGLWVAVGNRAYTSPDGATWTERDTDDSDGIAWAATQELWVAVGDLIKTSPDGITWTLRHTVTAGDWLGKVFEKNGIIVAAGYSVNRVYTSPDGLTWTPRTVPSTTTDVDIYCVNWVLDRFVMVGYNNTGWQSVDGITWSFLDLAGFDRGQNYTLFSIHNEGWRVIITDEFGVSYYGGHQHDAAEAPIPGTVAHSGLHDTYFNIVPARRQISTDFYPNDIVFSAAWNKFVAVGRDGANAGKSFHSVDLKTWTAFTGTQTAEMNAVVQMGNHAHAVGNGFRWRSTNLTSWTETAMTGVWRDMHMRAVSALSYGTGLVTGVAVGDGGIIQSYDGDANVWTSRTSGVATDLKSVCYSEELRLWVIVGATGTRLTSPDGITWTDRTSGTTTLTKVTYQPGRGFWANAGTALWISLDGTRWVDSGEGTGFTQAPNELIVLHGALWGVGTNSIFHAYDPKLISMAQASAQISATCHVYALTVRPRSPVLVGVARDTSDNTGWVVLKLLKPIEKDWIPQFAALTAAAYTADDESGAYTGIANTEAGTVFATVADLNALRTAYETLRAMTEDLRTKLTTLDLLK